MKQTQTYLENLERIEKTFGKILRYGGVFDRKNHDLVMPKKPRVKFIPDEDNGQQISLYTNKEWAIVQYSWFLIEGFKECKGQGKSGRFTEDDYWDGKSLLEGVRKGLFN